MEAITVRFEQDVMDGVNEAARYNGLSKAQIVRLAVSGNLLQYLQNVRIVSPADSDTLKLQIAELCDLTQRAVYELNRIGVNLNQIAKDLNGQVKAGKDIPNAKLHDIGIMQMHVQTLVNKYEKALGKAGEQLCRILG